MRYPFPIALVAAIVLAGCAADAPAIKSSDNPEATAAPSGAPTTDIGQINGLVIDDESKPLEGAKVALVENGLTVQSGGDGAFAFKGLPLGDYTVVAERLGYDSFAKRVTIADETPVQVTILLAAIEISVARQQSFITDAFVHLWIYNPAVSARPNATDADYRDIYIRVAPDLVSSVIGMTWSPGPLGGYWMQLALWVSDKSCASGTLCTRLNLTAGTARLSTRSDDFGEHAEGKKSIQINPAITPGLCYSTSNPTSTTNCGTEPRRLAQVLLEQRFTVYTSAFFVDGAPPDFSPFPPA